jgi:hypothetical protein
MPNTERLPPDNLSRSVDHNQIGPLLWYERLSRRTALRVIAGAAISSTVAPAIAAQDGKEPLQFEISRFMMKGDRPRLEVRARHYRLVWHSRYFALRLASTGSFPYDERISYSNFGPFAVGGLDLICGHPEPLTLTSGGKQVGTAPGTISVSEKEGVFLLEHQAGPGRLRIWIGCQPDSPELRFSILPEGFDQPLLIALPGHLIFDRSTQEEKAASSYSTGAGTGLRIAGEQKESVSVVDSGQGKIPGKTLVCRAPGNRCSEWVWTILGPDENAKKQPASAPTAKESLSQVKCSPLPVSQLKSWENNQMALHKWKVRRGQVKERVAGIYVGAHDWHDSGSWPATVEAVEKQILPKIIESRKFQAVGLTRDGITERGENEGWFRLVAAAHRAGLRVYMKPGDGEITHFKNRDALTNWAKTCFDVGPEHQCDVIRLPWEAVVVPWVTANLCLPDRFLTPELKNLAGLDWETARKRILDSMTDRFSFVIESIRRHAPKVTIDIECGDTAVFEQLLRRHENLGVQYMCYGFYPRIAEYLDLYYAVARFQLGAKRVVMETDCYYTAKTVTNGGLLKTKPFEPSYPQEELALLVAKHRHMYQLPAEAAWAFGVNIAYTDEKLDAVFKAAA